VLLQAKTRELKQNLNNEFRSIHELCMFVLANTRKVELLRATLTALAAYLSWIPPGATRVLLMLQQQLLCCLALYRCRLCWAGCCSSS
jgi:hypothetical protein